MIALSNSTATFWTPSVLHPSFYLASNHLFLVLVICDYELVG
jgi:hypothetical protein